MVKLSLAAARVNAGLTQQEMADKMGVARSTVIDWESGKREMKSAYIIAFCAVTGITTDDILLPENTA